MRRQHRLVSMYVWAAVFGFLLLAGTLAGVWALPGQVALGQTIPPPPTATPTKTSSMQATATWTPLPTWTPVATLPAEPPMPTATPGGGQPTSQPPVPTETLRPAEPTATAVATLLPSATATSAALLRTPTPASSGTPALPVPSPSAPALPTRASPQPMPLALEVAVLPQVAGPQDAVQFVVQVANVGYVPVGEVQVEVLFPDGLLLQFVECARCTTDCPQCTGGPVPARLTIFMGSLPAGDQIIATVHAQVSDDAWPGQTLRTEWALSAADLPTQTKPGVVELPWARLPATGGE